MKQVRNFLLLIVLMSVSLTSFAQYEKYAGTMYENMSTPSFEWASARLNSLDAIVNLSEAQKVEVEAINMRYAYRLDALFANGLEAEVIQNHQAGLFEYRMADYKNMLTNEQLIQLMEHTEDLRKDNLAY